jgi:hypothetical protein
MAWDAARNVGLIHGGIGAWPYPILSDTWEWNGSQWTQRSFQGPVLSDHSMAYDESSGRVVLYGGRNAAGEWQNATWEFDGLTGWAQRSIVPGIPPVEGAAMTFDRRRGRVVGVPSGMAHGGTVSPQTSAFEWNGDAWLEIASTRPQYQSVIAAWTDPRSGAPCFLAYGAPPGGSGSTNLVLRLIDDRWEVQGASSSQYRELVVAGLNPVTNKLQVFGGAIAPATAAPANVLELTTSWPSDVATTITSQPQPQLLVPNASAVFSVTAAGSGLGYQWRRNGTPLVSGGRISGATTATLTISSVMGADQGSFDCVVSGLCGTATSSLAPLSCSPLITQQPQGGEFVGGSAVTLVTAVATSGVTSYRWRRNGTNLFNSQTYSGVTTPTLVIRANDPNDSGAYTLAITNACGTTISDAAVVEVSCLSDFNLDGGVDGEDLFVFFAAWEQGQPEADVNQDGGVDFGDVVTFFERWENGC